MFLDVITIAIIKNILKNKDNYISNKRNKL